MSSSEKHKKMTDSRVPLGNEKGVGSRFGCGSLLSRETCCVGRAVYGLDSQGSSQNWTASDSAACLPPGHEKAVSVSLCASGCRAGTLHSSRQADLGGLICSSCAHDGGGGPPKQLQGVGCINRAQTRGETQLCSHSRPNTAPPWAWPADRGEGRDYCKPQVFCELEAGGGGGRGRQRHLQLAGTPGSHVPRFTS